MNRYELPECYEFVIGQKVTDGIHLLTIRSISYPDNRTGAIYFVSNDDDYDCPIHQDFTGYQLEPYELSTLWWEREGKEQHMHALARITIMETLKAKLEYIAQLSDIGELFDGHDELNEYTHEANEQHMTAALDRINAIASFREDIDGNPIGDNHE